MRRCMRKRYAVVTGIALLFIMCGKKPEKVVLKQGTKEYNLANEIALIVPALDPEKNAAIISSDRFVITAGEVIQVISQSPESVTKELLKMPGYKIAGIAEGMARDLAEKKLLIGAAKKAGIKVPGPDLDAALQQIYGNYGGEVRFEMQLREYGIDRENFIKDVENGLLVDAYLDEAIGSRIGTVSDEDVRNYCTQDTTVTLRHVLVTLPSREKIDVDFKKKIILTVKKLAEQGLDFSKLAERYSEDSATKANGGLMEHIHRGSTEAPFDSAAFATPVNSISGIVRTTYGFHVLKVLKREPGTFNPEDDNEALRAKIINIRWQEKRSEVLDSLKEANHYMFMPLR